MRQQATPHEIDNVLLPFLRTTDESEAKQLLAQLISSEAEPIIRSVVGGKLDETRGRDNRFAGQEAEEVCSEAVLQLLVRLHELKTRPESNPISDFRGYVAVIAYNACHRYLRQKYPQRWRLKNRLRYLLIHDKGFALWEESGEWLCGLTAWQGQRARGRTAQLREQADSLRGRAIRARHQLAEMVNVLRAIFEWLGAPVEIDEMVGLVADLQGIKDQTNVESLDDDETRAREARLADPRVDVATEVERRLYLEKLWAEIMQLPTRQRAALLLNLRDLGEGVIALLPLLGIATIRQIAEAVALPAEEFARYWPLLPIDDATIAKLLSVTRQQVINLRKAARARLARRMRSSGFGVQLLGPGGSNIARESAS